MLNYASIIKEIRYNLKISQQELAKLLNVSFATLNRWENGRFNPTLKKEQAIINLYNETTKNNLKPYQNNNIVFNYSETTQEKEQPQEQAKEQTQEQASKDILNAKTIKQSELKELRQSLHISMQEIEKTAGVKVSILSKIENARQNLTKDVKEKLEKFYNKKIEPSTIIYRFNDEITPRETKTAKELKELKIKLKQLEKENLFLKNKLNKIMEIIGNENI